MSVECEWLFRVQVQVIATVSLSDASSTERSYHHLMSHGARLANKK